jgi:hypothetical protein
MMKLIQNFYESKYVWFWEEDDVICSPIFETQDEALDWIESIKETKEELR